MEQTGRANAAVFYVKDVAKENASTAMRVVLKQNHDNPQHTLGHFRIAYATAMPSEKSLVVNPPEVDSILSVSVPERTEAQRSQLEVFYRTIAPELEHQRNELKNLEGQLAKLNSEIPTTLVTKRVDPRGSSLTAWKLDG